MKMRCAVVACLFGLAWVAPSLAQDAAKEWHEKARELGKAMGIWGASAPAGGTAGVFLGGVITEWLDWRWVFLINVPVAVAVLALTPVLLRRSARRGSDHAPKRRRRQQRQRCRPIAGYDRGPAPRQHHDHDADRPRRHDPGLAARRR